MINEMKVTIIRGSAKRKPQAGDERFLKGRGVWQIRQQKRVPDGFQYAGAYEVSNGRPVWEWVDKGGPRDRSAVSGNPKKTGGHAHI